MIMVAPHPDLQRKIRNTKKLVKQKQEHLIPGMVERFPDDYFSLDDFEIIQEIKPWVETPRPVKHRAGPPGYGSLGVQTLQASSDRIIVLCVDFSDKPSQISTAPIYDRFFGTGKSLKNYYIENSYGKYIFDGEVHGWYRAPQPYSYYVNNDNGFGTYPNNTQKLVEDTINIAASDPAIIWSSFDNDHDHIIDHLFVVHAGAEAAYTGSLSDIWAHVWEINPVLHNGYGFQYYACTSEYIASIIDPQRTGIDSHEFGHVLGLPDLYDYSGNSNGVGSYSIMAYGSWADDAFTPVHLDAWSKYFLGFSNTIVNPSGTIPVSIAETYNTNYLFTTQVSNEYFMVENRQNLYYDQFLPASGLLVWKVNESKSTNDNELCFKVALIQADGRRDLENSVNYGDAGDPFPGSTVKRSIGASTVPNTVLCSGTLPNLEISNITDSADVMYFDALLQVCPEIRCNLIIA
jgi:immune inhibitor A